MTGYRIVWTTPSGERRWGTQLFASATAACIEAEQINALMDEAYAYTIEPCFVNEYNELETEMIEEDGDYGDRG